MRELLLNLGQTGMYAITTGVSDRARLALLKETTIETTNDL